MFILLFLYKVFVLVISIRDRYRTIGITNICISLKLVDFNVLARGTGTHTSSNAVYHAGKYIK